jgi:hypothetical protein
VEPVEEKPPTKVAVVPPKKPASSKGIRAEREGVNVIPTPASSSGDGVLTVTATPWAYVVVDGVQKKETPMEFRVGAGSYRIKGVHPTLGTSREETVKVEPGKRKQLALTFAN